MSLKNLQSVLLIFFTIIFSLNSHAELQSFNLKDLIKMPIDMFSFDLTQIENEKLKEFCSDKGLYFIPVVSVCIEDPLKTLKEFGGGVGAGVVGTIATIINAINGIKLLVSGSVGLKHIAVCGAAFAIGGVTTAMNAYFFTQMAVESVEIESFLLKKLVEVFNKQEESLIAHKDLYTKFIDIYFRYKSKHAGTLSLSIIGTILSGVCLFLYAATKATDGSMQTNKSGIGSGILLLVFNVINLSFSSWGTSMSITGEINSKKRTNALNEILRMSNFKADDKDLLYEEELHHYFSGTSKNELIKKKRTLENKLKAFSKKGMNVKFEDISDLLKESIEMDFRNYKVTKNSHMSMINKNMRHLKSGYRKNIIFKEKKNINEKMMKDVRNIVRSFGVRIPSGQEIANIRKIRLKNKEEEAKLHQEYLLFITK
jgi:hypothetical protein